MPRQMVTLVLSESGWKVLGRPVFELSTRSRRGVYGTLVSYQDEGVWFQDEKLSRDNKIVLVKWTFIDAILSDIPQPELARGRSIGFQATEFRATE